jgi:ABC-type nickel/cobalt efflux system permease component RcnA
MRIIRLAIGSGAILLALIAAPQLVIAHPMGNFSINHYSRIVIRPRVIELDYIIDMAEIPTFQETQRSGIKARLDDPLLPNYLERQDQSFKQGLLLMVGGRPLMLRTISRQALFPPGAGGLPTAKLGFVYESTLTAAPALTLESLHYTDHNFPGRAGWKEIVVNAVPGAGLIKSSAPQTDRSLELTNYPTDMLHSPPQLLQADVTFKVAAAATTTNAQTRAALSTGWLDTSGVTTGVILAANRQGTPRNAFTDLIKSNRIDLAFLLMAAAIAAVLGGFHALEPGHGKTLVAAYLVGSHGNARHAVMLGGIVTASHTVSVYALGLITLYASQWIMPEQLYPWLGMASGALVAGLGLTLFVRRYIATKERSAGGHFHGGTFHYHASDHRHEHLATLHRHSWWGGHLEDGDRSLAHFGAHDHSHDDVDRVSATREDLSLRSLLALGITGGIIPCPAALVVLLAALAIHRVLFGLFLIVAFSLGLAAVLIGFGLAMVYAGRFVSRFSGNGLLTQRWLPLASSAVITAVGVALTLQSLITAGVLHVGT